jgi:hypothetical protein
MKQRKCRAIFDEIEYIIFRLTILALLIISAWRLIRSA